MKRVKSIIYGCSIKSEEEFNKEDFINIERMSVKELGHYFTEDLTKITRDTTLLTIVDKCITTLE
uniref:hypothetical protein n=1 Tax=Kingella denitrificans TaxID=502 RepID=UPI001C9B235C